MAIKRRTKMSPSGIKEEVLEDDNVDFLVRALNYPVIPKDLLPEQLTQRERSPWRENEKFCIWLGEQVQEFKAQISFLRAKAGQPIHESLVRDFYSRYERHRGVFKEVQIEWQLRPTYNVVTALSREVSFAKLQENHALNGLFNLLEQRKLDSLRKCDICHCWFLATRSDQIVCKKACRQKKNTNHPEHNARRREIYLRKKQGKVRTYVRKGKK